VLRAEWARDSRLNAGQSLWQRRWIVTSISRNFPAAVSDAQKADIRKQLDERYGPIGSDQRAAMAGPTEIELAR
jgi:hypothetical protein